jgi:cobaltochelatase CobN
VQWLKQEWKLRGLLKQVHLTISGCLGPCDVPNVVMITHSEGTQWLARLSSQRHYTMLADWAEQSKIADELIPLPKELRELALMPYREQRQLVFEGQR